MGQTKQPYKNNNQIAGKHIISAQPGRVVLANVKKYWVQSFIGDF
jgi:hypothetical protein